MTTTMKTCLVVKRTDMFPRTVPNGYQIIGSPLGISSSDLGITLAHNAFFAEREFMEERAEYLQIIPVVLLARKVDEDTVELLAYRRADKHTEQRLANKMCFFFGGHIEPCDRRWNESSTLNACVRRELKEELGICTDEIVFRDPFPYGTSCGAGKKFSPNQVALMGVINSEDTPVDQVHVGMLHVLLLENFDGLQFDPREIGETVRVRFNKNGLLHWSGAGTQGIGANSGWDTWSSILLEAKDFFRQLFEVIY